ncbi:hypothetical protein ACEUDK_15765 [Aeromonas veronii]
MCNRHNKLRHWLCGYVATATLLGAVLLTVEAQAAEAADATDATQVTLKSWLKDQGEEKRPYAVNQQITLYLELATNRWFTAGTRIGQFELPGVMVKQRSELATNFTQAAMAKPGRTSAGS